MVILDEALKVARDKCGAQMVAFVDMLAGRYVALKEMLLPYIKEE